MNRAFLLALLLAALTACKKQESGAASKAVEISLDQSNNGPVTVFPDVIVVPDTGDAAATMGQLTTELRRFVLRSKTSPKTFEDFVAQAYVQAPPPPAGKKYAISSGSVVLADR